LLQDLCNAGFGRCPQRLSPSLVSAEEGHKAQKRCNSALELCELWRIGVISGEQGRKQTPGGVGELDRQQIRAGGLLVWCNRFRGGALNKQLQQLAALVLALGWTASVAMAQNAPAAKGIDPALLAKATAGNREAAFLVGVDYELGKGVAKDSAKAAAWYRKAAEKGDPRAQHSLGVLYELGDGLPLDYAQATEWYRKAANLGFAPAQFSLGLCYVHGRGVSQDYGQAVSWYQKAAAQQNTDALLNLALLYHNGEGVPKDEKQAFLYIRLAAAAGAADAQFQLAMDYNEGGHQLRVDPQQAEYWFRKSAEQGYLPAQFNLAMLLKDQPEEAYYWLSLAAPHMKGESLAKTAKLREAASAKLTADARTGVDERVNQWLAAHRPKP